MSDPYHAGERTVQEKAGERDRAVVNSRAVGTRIPAQAESFLCEQRYCVLGACSPDGDPWATFLAGPPGFARADDSGSRLKLNLLDDRGLLHTLPPFASLRAGDSLGALFIDLMTRRRLRLNGYAESVTRGRLEVRIEQAYGNCPKYIQRREAISRAAVPAGAVARGRGPLSGELAEWVAAADTFFVAGKHPDGPADASHRGGAPGFIRLKQGALRIPDYPGNSMFNTLGNFVLYPRAGLCFVDFERNRQLQITGDVRLHLDSGEDGGPGRYWELLPRAWVVSPINRPMAWRLLDPSPFNPRGFPDAGPFR